MVNGTFFVLNKQSTKLYFSVNCLGTQKTGRTSKLISLMQDKSYAISSRKTLCILYLSIQALFGKHQLLVYTRAEPVVMTQDNFGLIAQPGAGDNVSFKCPPYQVPYVGALPT